MEQEYLDPSTGHTYSKQAMDRIFSEAKIEGEIDANVSFQDYITSQGFKIQETQPKKEFKNISRENFDNVPEDELIERLELVYGDDIEIKQSQPGLDAIMVKDKVSGMWKNIVLDTQYNRDGGGIFTSVPEDSPDAYETFMSILTQISPGDIEKLDVSAEQQEFLKQRYYTNVKNQQLKEDYSMNLDAVGAGVKTTKAGLNDVGQTVYPTLNGQKLNFTERTDLLFNIKNKAEGLWLDVLSSPESYGINPNILDHISNIDEASLSPEQKQGFNDIVWDLLNKKLGKDNGLFMDEETFQDYFSAWTPVFDMAETKVKYKIAQENFNAAANAGTLPDEMGLVQAMDTGLYTMFTQDNPELIPRINIIKKLNTTTFELEKISNQILELENTQNLSDKDAKKLKALYNSYNTHKAQWFKDKTALDKVPGDILQYNYKGERPEDADIDEVKWKRLRAATEEIEQENGITNISELTNLAGYYKNLQKQRLLEQQDACNTFLSVDLTKLKSNLNDGQPKTAYDYDANYLVYSLLEEKGYDVSGDSLDITLNEYLNIVRQQKGFNEYQAGWQAEYLDEDGFWFGRGPESESGGYGLVFPGLGDDDIRTAALHNEWMMANQDKLEVLYEKINIQPDLNKQEEEIELGGETGFWGTASNTAKSFGLMGMLDETDREIARDENLFFGGGSKGLGKSRYKLDTYRDLISEINEVRSDEGITPVKITPEELEALAVNVWGAEGWGQTVGGFAPVAADLAVSFALIESGLGTAAGLANLNKYSRYVRMYLNGLNKTSTGVNKAMFYVMTAAKMEAETQLAGFNTGSGATFSIFGNATQKLKIISKLRPKSAAMIDISIKASLGGVVATEIATGIVEPIILDITDQDSFNQWWHHHYGDLDEVTQRVIKNGVLFWGYGTKGIMYKTAKRDAATRTLWRSSRQNSRAIGEIEKKIKELEKKAKEDELGLFNFKDKIKTLKETVQTITIMEAQKQGLGDMSALTYNETTKDWDINPEFKTKTQDLLNEMAKEGGSKAPTVEIVETLGTGNKGAYEFKDNLLQINPKALNSRGQLIFNQGVVPHEMIVHWAVRSRLANNPQLLASWTPKLKESIQAILKDKLSVEKIDKEILEAYGKWNETTGKWEMNEGLKAEELLAFYVEWMANPVNYYSTIGNNFLKNQKNEFLNILEGSGLKKYTEKSIAQLSSVEALEVMARLANEMTFGRSGGSKIRVAQNLDQLKDPLLETRILEEGQPKPGEYKILDIKTSSKELGSEVSKKLKDIATRNKIQEDKIINEGAWKLSEVENIELANEIKNTLIENNQGLVEMLANRAYNNPNIAGLEAGLKIPLKDWRQGFNQQLIEMINSYEPIPQDGSSKGKQVPFGAYIAKNLPRRYGNILAAEKGKTPESGGRITKDIIAETATTELAGDLILARELNIKNEVLTNFENKLKEEIDLAADLDLLSYEKFRTTWPKGIVNDIFGRTREQREKYIRDNAEALMASFPDLNQNVSGKSLGVGTNVLNFMYGEGPRAKMSEGAGGAGLNLREKQTRTPQELIDFLGLNIKPGQKGYTNSQAKIKGVINLAMRGLANQILRDPSKTKLQESLTDFSVLETNVREALEVWSKRNQTELELVEQGKLEKIRESDLNILEKRVDKEINKFLREAKARLRDGLSGELYSKDSKILNQRAWNEIRDQKPTNLTELRNIVGKEEYKVLSSFAKSILKEVRNMFKGDMNARDNLYILRQAMELNMSVSRYKKEYMDQIGGWTALSKELKTTDTTIPSLAHSKSALEFSRALIKKLPAFGNLPKDMQATFMKTFGFGDHSGGFVVNGKKFNLEAHGLSRGQYSELMTEVFGPGWQSNKAVPQHWKNAYSPGNWGKALNTRIAKILKSNKDQSIKFQEIENLFKKEGIDFDAAVQSNLNVLKDTYVAIGTLALEMKNEGKSNTEILQSIQDFFKVQTNRSGGILKTLVPVLFLDILPKKGKKGQYAKKSENYYTEHMRELFNANKQFIRHTKKLLEGNIKLDIYNKRLDRGIQDLMQGLISARTSEIKDAPGKTFQWYYDPILSITMGGKRSLKNTISLYENNIYNPTTLVDMVYDTGSRYAMDIINKTPGKDLTAIGVQVKTQMQNPKNYDAVNKKASKLSTYAGMNYSKDLSTGEYLGQLKNRDKSLELAREIKKKTKGISVFDFDDTLAKTKSKVIVNLPYYAPGKMTESQMRISPAEFAKRYSDLESMGASFDFREFEKVIGGTKGPLFDLAVKRQGKFGTGDIYILTARPQAASPAIHAFLKGMGLNIPLENIVGLENGAPKAKSDWILKKASEGYNDFYFADDAYKNVKAVQDVLSVIDVKSKVQQALMSKNLNNEYNKVIEESFGVEKFKDYSQTKGRTVGAKHKESWWLPASASDLPLLMDRIAGKGKQGDAHQKLFKETLYDPYAQAEMNITEAKLSILRDFKELKNQSSNVVNQLKNKVGDYSVEQALRVRNWDILGIDIPGISARDKKMLVDHVNKNSELVAFGDQIISMQKGVYNKPGRYWETGNLLIDINNTIKGDLRDQYMKQFNDNVTDIFTPEFYNKLEAVQGPKYVESLKHILSRIKRGSNRTGKESRIETKMLNFLNNATAGIMFLNTRSAILQTISSFNYINWTDNNPFKAAARFANLPQYVKDWNRLMNSDWAVARRKGTRINIQEAELVEALEGQQNKGDALLGYILEKGFILTKMGDTFATATGGATFYRNRINSYKKQGMSEKVAERQAYEDWVELSELNQQSARMDKISMQQATPLGRVVLAFANTPMQYARLQKRAYLDLVNNRGDAKTNISKIVYYAFVQNLIFNAMQNALFTEIYDEPGVSDDKTIRIANGMVDGILRGGGIYGAGVSTIKNTALKLYNESQKKRSKYSNAAWETLGISPPLKSKVSKVRNGFAALEYNMKEIKSSGFALDNPAYLAAGNLTAGFTNVPLDRLIIKLQNIQDSFNEELQWYERLSLLGGWPEWQLGIDDGKTAKYFGDDSIEDTTNKKEKKIMSQADLDLLFKINNP